MIQKHDATDRLGEIKVPTLVLAGEEDILIPVRLSQEAAAGHPRRGVEDRSRRACLPVGDPEPFNAAFLDFVSQDSPSQPSERKAHATYRILLERPPGVVAVLRTIAALSLGVTLALAGTAADGRDDQGRGRLCAPR